MILKRILIIIAVVIAIGTVGASLLFLGNKDVDNDNKVVDIYENTEKQIQEENKELIMQENNKKEETKLVEDKIETEKVENVEKVETESIVKTNEVEQSKVTQTVVSVEQPKQNNQPTLNTETKIENKVIETKVESPKNEVQENITNDISIKNEVKEEVKPQEDVYTFVKNDKEIQNMIAITKRLIRENKDGRYSELVDYVDNINFVIQKSGNLFYPFFEYRIANIIMDNSFPEFYVYAEDIYKNGEYLRTEYYFQ